LNDFLSLHLTQLLLLHYLGKTDQANCVEVNEKTPMNSIYPDLWPATASQLQGLTVIKQCVYQMTFRFMNSKSDWWSLDLSEAEHYRYWCQWMWKVSPCLCSHNAPTFQASLL